MATQVFRQAIVEPFYHPLVGPPGIGFRGGLVIEGGDEAAQCLRHTRYWQPVDVIDDRRSYEVSMPGEFTYAGPVYGHFGHFMSEMVHRILPSRREFRNDRWVFVTTENDPYYTDFDKFPIFLKQVLDFLDISDCEIHISRVGTRFEVLNVSEQGSDFGGGPKDDYLDVLTEFSQRKRQAVFQHSVLPDKVYVSRSGIPPGGSILGERYIEQHLESEGFTIFHPEKHSFLEQIAIYENCKTLVFSEGSACHGVELLGSQTVDKCIFISRRPDHREIFRRVLAPRSKSFVSVDCCFPLGSIVIDPSSGALLDHQAVALLNMEEAIKVLREADVANLRQLSIKNYYREAEEDLMRYLVYHDSRGCSAPIEQFHTIWQKMKRIIRNIGHS